MPTAFRPQEITRGGRFQDLRAVQESNTPGPTDLVTHLTSLSSPEAVHLLHVVQGDHAVSQDDVQEAVGAEQQLAPQVLAVQLGHLHQRAHRPRVHLVGRFPDKETHHSQYLLFVWLYT